MESGGLFHIIQSVRTSNAGITMKKFLAQLSFALTIVAIALPGGSCQSCHLRELDLCAATLVLFNQSPTGVATNEPDLNRQCTYINEAEQCFKNFTLRCMTPLQRELLGFVSEGSEKLLNEYCTPGTDLRAKVEGDTLGSIKLGSTAYTVRPQYEEPRLAECQADSICTVGNADMKKEGEKYPILPTFFRIDYLKHAPCLNDAHTLQKDCLTDLQAGLEAISTSEFQNRIPMACCGYQRYMTCARNTVEKKCGKAAVDFMQLLLRNAVSRLPDIVCTGYGSENHECRKLLPPPGSPPQGSKSDSVLSRLFAAYLGN